MSRILTFSEQNVLAKIDDLINTYCDQCPIKTRPCKLEEKTRAHYSYISECSIGKEIKQLENELQ